MKDLAIKSLDEKTYPFLTGDGEMAMLTRSKEWSTTPVGAIDKWPQSLRTTLGILLNSKFPMFLWWGKELTCFYNDAYRPSLGQEGKHPAILGMPAKQAWPEIWDIIEPLIQQVLNGGGAVWAEDQLIPIYRNGKIEDVYWTFSYSPVMNETGKITGVLVTCTETTEKVKNLQLLAQNKDELNVVINASELGTWDLTVETGHVNYSDRTLEILGLPAGSTPSRSAVLAHMHPDDIGVREKAFEDAYECGTLRYELRVIWDDHSTHWIESKGKVFYDADKKPTRILGTLMDITSQTNYHQQLKESQTLLKETAERLSLATEGTQISTWDFNLETGEILHSPRLAKIFGFDESVQLPHPLMREVMHPYDRVNIVEKAFETALKTGIYYYEARIIHPDKTIHWIRTRGKVIFENGKAVRMLGTLIDITDSKIAEVDMAQLAAIVQSSEDAIISKTLDGIITTWNAAAERIFGYTADEMIGQPMLKLFPEDRIEEEPKILEQLKKGQRVDHFETKRVTKDKKQLDVSLTISPVRDSNGTIIGASKIARDITQQKLVERLIKEREEKFRLLADSMPQFIWTSDAAGNLNYYNQAVFDYSGLTLEQLNKDGWLQIVHPDDREENMRLWIHAVTTGTDFNFEHRFRRFDGEYRWQLSRAIPQRDNDGVIQMWVGSSTDIQEMKELDQQKDYFISMASHELKTPITSIKGYVQMLQSMYAGSTDLFLKNSLSIVDKQLVALTKLITDLLDLSKIKSGSLLLSKEQFQVNDMVRDILLEMKHINPDYEISFTGNKETMIYADRERIGQVLINLLTNAVKYSPNSKSVKVASIATDKDIIISVEDSGIGINKFDQEKIFERFYRVEGKNEKTFPGFGIGLFIASEIIHRHHGKIAVKSEPGKGSVFSFSLPLNNESRIA